ncbi:hypothetical protein BV898_06144 [Hypsibius exemplaris]|uniref:Uncharacterized protein n=1 Tax=Hypsibius exemplaris TaxID=2072580 RepID=A0A1W0WXF0_HYPEX|nr:hypothetical protein BV898_06144 [Hypsibius exemplaris]
MGGAAQHFSSSTALPGLQREIAANKTAREMEKTADVLNAPNWKLSQRFPLRAQHYHNHSRCFRIIFEQLVLMKRLPKSLPPTSRINRRISVRSTANSHHASSCGERVHLHAGSQPAPLSPTRSMLVCVTTDSPALAKKPSAAMPRSPVQPRPQQYRDFKPTIVVQDGDKPPEVRSTSLADSTDQRYGYTADQLEILHDAEKAEKTVPVLDSVVAFSNLGKLGADNQLFGGIYTTVGVLSCIAGIFLVIGFGTVIMT